MSLSRALLWLCVAVGTLAFASAIVGLLWQGIGASYSMTTFRGQAVEIYGRGLYRYDTLLFVGNNRSSDPVMLFLGIPLLAMSLYSAIRGSFRARLVLLGTLGFFLYIGATYALGGVAYNQMFLVYVALFSASLFALILAFEGFDRREVDRYLSGELPRRLAGVFLIASGVVTLAIWVMEPIGSLLSADPPKGLETHDHTLHACPGHSRHRADRDPCRSDDPSAPFLRYIVAFSLLILEALLMPLIAIATIVQVRLGIEFEPGEVIGPIAGFSIFAVLSLWIIVAVLRRVPGQIDSPLLFLMDPAADRAG